jgi:hypothetical protein
MDFINECMPNTDWRYALYGTNTQGHSYGLAFRITCSIQMTVRRKGMYRTGNIINTINFTAQSVK